MRRNWLAADVTSHRQTLDLPYRPEDLFDLAADVGRYPEFVTWIQSLKLVSQQYEPERSRCRAEVTVGFKGFRETFVTDVDARKPELAIDVTLVRGPFKKLANSWRFSPSPTGSRVDFTIQFEFRNFVLQALADANKTYAVKRVIDAFVAEASRRYPKVVPTS
ncbi:MAG TPA: type II toxin-antitoxin system RatA family toxin [Hyphomonadaceae bacterium]|nr:type II toxin-antitoxin system RatA family toxin [Hyphomonadaceae bacterium]HPN06507.1 type II toxin-antitoxin system RatA family toxin [Hyphomonadaceae bacterium]